MVCTKILIGLVEVMIGGKLEKLLVHTEKEHSEPKIKIRFVLSMPETPNDRFLTVLINLNFFILIF